MRRSSRRLAVLVLLVAGGCARAPRLALPSGAGTPVPDAAARYREATATCAGVRTLTAEIALSGRAAGSRVRGKVLAGTGADGRLRLEGIAPFGAPPFVLVSDGESSTLLLPRDGRVVRGARVEDLLDALAGLRLSARDLHALLAGCAAAPREVRSGRAFGDEWLAVDLDGGVTVWTRATPHATIAAASFGALSAQYVERASEVPSRLRILVEPGATATDVDLTLRLTQVETNPAIDQSAFTVVVDDDVRDMSLLELREHGLLGR